MLRIWVHKNGCSTYQIIWGEDGMSSEESDIDMWTGIKVYYIKEITWCKDMQHKMTLINNECHKEKQLFTKKGAKPMSRI